MGARAALIKLLGLCVLAGVLLAGMLFPAVGALGVVSNRASDTVDSISSDLVQKDPPLLTTVLDAQGNQIAYLFDQYRVLAPPDKIADTMKAALVSIEDQRFYEHDGVDFRGAFRALITNTVEGKVAQGGSTLTQQYVKNYLTHVVATNKVEQAKASEQTPARKLREMRIALQLERKLGKDEILTRYLNIVPFGASTYGVAAAAKTYFDTTPDKLTIAQAALLAGMVNEPSGLNPKRAPEAAINRRNLVIDQMAKQGRIPVDVAEVAKKEPLGTTPDFRNPPNGCVGAGPSNGFFCKYVIDYLSKIGYSADALSRGGFTIKTTLDPRVTQAAKKAAEGRVPKDANGVANTMAVVQPGKDRHKVLALVANRDYGLDADKGQTTYALPSAVANKFGSGSIFKIFTAAAALEKGMGINNSIATPSYYASRTFKGGAARCPAAGGGERFYCLSNAGDNYPGSMTLQSALATSPNTGFVILEERVGMGPVVDMAVRLGLRETMATNVAGVKPDPKSKRDDLNRSQSDYWRNNKGAFTLGPAAVSTLELANVSATIMSGGTWCPPSPIEQILDRNGRPIPLSEAACEQAVPEGLANGLAQGLSKDDLPGGTAAGARPKDWARPMMGKTGTTQDHKSAGFVGATPQYAGAVLTFNDGNRPQVICKGTPPRLCGGNTGGGIFGSSVSAPTWFDAMSAIHGNQPVQNLPAAEPRYLNGGDEAKVPNVVGMMVNDATSKLQEAGYKVTTQNRNDAAAKGKVIGQDPRGAALPGETITLFVSTGYVPPPTGTTEPSTPPEGGGPTIEPGEPGEGGGG
ncbi:membrane peptidoglycan carboxypeptidase [Crossiella equi]|uniref:Membrane peptidoglycan carboxypeptidase n=1 Tax=Crossiella equi TaxID=130796 RepID=A0ABS5AFC7_9PSEU|nr:transglycosylase domain-containing protein [Crossiella equi]MBP2475294.1 membrane peptidoglycan carboxypeptidase [Crossiella equi]